MKIEVGAEWLHAVVDVAVDTTTVFAGPCLVRRVFVNTVLSAHALPIEDNSVAIFTLPASSAAGTNHDLGDVRFETNLIVNPDNAATGNVTIVYKPNHEGLAGSGA